jgi:hypothetical protein
MFFVFSFVSLRGYERSDAAKCSKGRHSKRIHWGRHSISVHTANLTVPQYSRIQSVPLLDLLQEFRIVALVILRPTLGEHYYELISLNELISLGEN